MKAPALGAVLERRILVNYRVDPDLLGSYPPAPFRPVLLADHAPGPPELLGKSTARPRRPHTCDNGVVRCPVIADRNDAPE
jgi:hypothetical protein